MKTITVDCTQFTSYDRVHRTIKNAGMDYEGANLDALYDALTSTLEKTFVILEDFGKITQELDDYAKKLLMVFEDACADNENISFEIR